GLAPGENARHDYDAVAAREQPPAPATTTGNAALQLPPGVRIATGKPRPAGPAAAAVAEAVPSAMDRLIEGVLPGANASERPPAVAPPPTVVASAAPAAPAAAAGQDWRFDMRQDGRAMTADEFDAWMRARRAHVATGKAGKPDPYGSAAPGAVAASRSLPAPAPETIAAARGADAVPAPTPPPATVAGVTLQVAAFGARANAERALAMLQGAGVHGARLLDAVSAGRQVWRLRVGPVENARVPELSARVAGLGFGQPQVVRE